MKINNNRCWGCENILNNKFSHECFKINNEIHNKEIEKNFFLKYQMNLESLKYEVKT
jgi:hypothetical protein